MSNTVHVLWRFWTVRSSFVDVVPVGDTFAWDAKVLAPDNGKNTSDHSNAQVSNDE